MWACHKVHTKPFGPDWWLKVHVAHGDLALTVTIKSSDQRVAVAPARTDAHTHRNLNKNEEISP